MKFFIDSADLKEIRDLNETGLVDGITTNPTLIAQNGGDIKKVLKEICTIVAGPVSGEVTALNHKEMLKEAAELIKIAPNLAIKVPLTFEGLKACRALSSQGVMVNVTLCFSAPQALLAAKAGAAFVSSFLGRLDDIGQNGLDLIQDIRLIYNNYPELETKILAASIRHPMHVLEAAKLGADIATVPPKVFRQLYNHPLTDKGIAAFLEDWKKTGQSIL